MMTAEQALAAAREATTDPAERARRAARTRANCPPPKPSGEIVVCAPVPDDPASAGYDKERAERDYAAKTMDKGAPRAPSVGTTYPGAVVGRGCYIPPCPPPMPRLIDLKAIPEPLEDSDAARVGRGDKAR